MAFTTLGSNTLLLQGKPMKNTVFYLGMGTLFTHELDAMLHHEWRLLPLINLLPDEQGMIVFLLFHIPLFAVLIALVASSRDTTRRISKMGISIFLVIHGALHTLFMGNAAYEFGSMLSNIIIFGGALFGTMYLFLDYKRKPRP